MPAKKQKRQVSRSASPVVRETGEPSISAEAPKINGASRYPVSSSRSSSVEFNPDYAPVISDLKRIGVLAGTFITILVVLSFFLR